MDRIRVAQGIWDADGEMRGDSVLVQSYYLCVTWANQADCDRALTTVGDLPSGDSVEATTRLNSVPVALPKACLASGSTPTGRARSPSSCGRTPARPLRV